MNGKKGIDRIDRPFKIMVFQQDNRGESKVKGILRYGRDQFDITLINIARSMELVIDDTSEYLPDAIEADLVLDYLKHPDLSHDLSLLCRRLGIPIVASGKKTVVSNTHTPPVCCALAHRADLGRYSLCFGTPEFDATVKEGKIVAIYVRRGAPCGATWEAAQHLKGSNVDEALARIGLETQFFCTADPSNWDPIGGKSPVHLAADLHRAALATAIKKALSQETGKQ